MRAKRFLHFPKKLAMLFMPFLLTFARLLWACVNGCFAFAAAAASAFVCDAWVAKKKKGDHAIREKKEK